MPVQPSGVDKTVAERSVENKSQCNGEPNEQDRTGPDGKKHARNVYARTREECEEKLKVLIVEMKEEIAEM